MTSPELQSAVNAALAKIANKLMHPENFDHQGHRIYSPSERKRRGQDPLKPRERLIVRLEIVCALKRCALAFTKEILADTEAIKETEIHETWRSHVNECNECTTEVPCSVGDTLRPVTP